MLIVLSWTGLQDSEMESLSLGYEQCLGPVVMLKCLDAGCVHVRSVFVLFGCEVACVYMCMCACVYMCTCVYVCVWSVRYVVHSEYNK